MKKILLVLAVSILVGMAFTACHAYEECPAYGTVEAPADDANG